MIFTFVRNTENICFFQHKVRIDVSFQWDRWIIYWVQWASPKSNFQFLSTSMAWGSLEISVHRSWLLSGHILESSNPMSASLYPPKLRWHKDPCLQGLKSCAILDLHMIYNFLKLDHRAKLTKMLTPNKVASWLPLERTDCIMKKLCWNCRDCLTLNETMSLSVFIEPRLSFKANSLTSLLYWERERRYLRMTFFT